MTVIKISVIVMVNAVVMLNMMNVVSVKAQVFYGMKDSVIVTKTNMIVKVLVVVE